jgi:hypothetical protein
MTLCFSNSDPFGRLLEQFWICEYTGRKRSRRLILSFQFRSPIDREECLPKDSEWSKLFDVDSSTSFNKYVCAIVVQLLLGRRPRRHPMRSLSIRVVRFACFGSAVSVASAFFVRFLMVVIFQIEF